MRTRLTAATLGTALLLAGTGCSSDSEPKPTPTKTVTVTATPTLSKAELTQQCTDAVALLPAGDDGSVPFEPVPTECAALAENEYLDAYMDGINQGNRDALQDRQDARDEAAENDQ